MSTDEPEFSRAIRHVRLPSGGRRWIAFRPLLKAPEKGGNAAGIDCEITGLVGIYSDPKHVILYTSNGEVRQEFSILLTARPLGGEPTPSDESREVRWVSPSDALRLTMDRSMRIRISDYLRGEPRPVVI